MTLLTSRPFSRFAALFLPLVLCTAAFGQDRETTEKRVVFRDSASLFSPRAIEAAERRLGEIAEKSAIPVTVETVTSLEGRPVEAASLERAARFPDGLYILLAKNERKIEVRVAERLRGRLGNTAAREIRDAFVSGLAEDNPDEGLRRGVLVIGRILDAARGAVRKTEALQSPGESAASTGSGLVIRNQVRLTLAGARRILAGAEKKAGEMGLKMNIAVVDDGGHLLTFARMDGARPASAATATTKAITAATFRQATGPLPAGTTTPDPLLNISLQNAAAASGGKITTLFGGLPVLVEGQVIGGVGVGGGSGEQDAVVAKAGIAAFLGELEPKNDGDAGKKPTAP